MEKKGSKAATIAVAAVLAVTAVIILFLNNSGKIEYTFDNDAISIHTPLWKNLTIKLDDIEKAELRNDISAGKRTNGYGSKKLNLGSFRNDEFGDYQLYSYCQCDTLVLITLRDGSVVVTGGENKAASENIYKLL